jgi:hypothetical protein
LVLCCKYRAFSDCRQHPKNAENGHRCLISIGFGAYQESGKRAFWSIFGSKVEFSGKKSLKTPLKRAISGILVLNKTM